MDNSPKKNENHCHRLHPHVVSNLYEFLSSAAEHKRRYLKECLDRLWASL